MKRLIISGIIVCLGLLIVHIATAGDPKGPPGGLGVEIVNPLPVPVTGDINSVVTGSVDVNNTPDVNVINNQSNPIPVNIKNNILTVRVATGYHFVGYTSNMYSGRHYGPLGAASRCQEDFPGSRMCTSQEFLNVLPTPTDNPNFDMAWLMPTIVTSYSFEDARYYYDVSGHETVIDNIFPSNYYLTCSDWMTNQSSQKGFAVNTETGRAELVSCYTFIPIACCAP